MEDICKVELGCVKQISHTADAGIIARERSLDHLFSLCCTALIEVLTGSNIRILLEKVQREGMTQKEINVSKEGQDLENLIVEYLTEVLYLLEAKGLLVVSSSVNIEKERSLKGIFSCVAYSKRKLGYLTEVKAVTYHAIRVERCTDDSWGARIIFDL